MRLNDGELILFTYGKDIHLGFVTAKFFKDSSQRLIECLTDYPKSWNKTTANNLENYPDHKKLIDKYKHVYSDQFHIFPTGASFLKVNPITLPISVDSLIEILKSKDPDAIAHIKEVIKNSNDNSNETKI